MKRILSLLLIGLLTSRASALNVYLVALSGPNAYHGGVPSLTNGSVGVNSSGGGATAAAGGAGIAVTPSGTGRIGILIELLSGTDGTYQNPDTPNGSNQLTTALVYFNQDTQGTPASVDLAGIEFTSVNDHGEEWSTATYSLGMWHWINWRYDGEGGAIAPGATPPLIEDYHLFTADDVSTCPDGNLCGGNSFEGNRLLLLQAITVHGRGLDTASIIFDTTSTFFETEGGKAYGFVSGAPGPIHGGNQAAPGGYWYAANGRTKMNAFRIESIPEPASVALLGLAGVAVLRRRRGELSRRRRPNPGRSDR
jgi:hypothetical protein